MRIHQPFRHVAHPQTPDRSTANVTSVSSGSSSSVLLSVWEAQHGGTGLGHVEALSGSCANRIVFACVANFRLFSIVVTLWSGSANFRT